MSTDRPDMRISDAERERVVAQLNAAVTEGRLTLAEFEERVYGVLRSRTMGEIEPYVGDLPQKAAGPERLEIRNQASNLKRQGRWSVPRRLLIETRAGSIKLDFTEAAFTTTEVEIELQAKSSSIDLVLPAGATADVDRIESRSSNLRAKVPAVYDTTGGIVFRISGAVRSSNVRVRYQRRFWRWRW